MLIAFANPCPKLLIFSSLLLKLFLVWAGAGGDLTRCAKIKFSGDDGVDGVDGLSSMTIWPSSSSE